MTQHLRPAFGTFILFAVAFVIGGYFTFAAVQGDHGLFRRVQVNAEAEVLRAERDRLQHNLNRRLSDASLDLDLLDERARDVLGQLRLDEVILN
jgi:cell division protein FtsB